MSEVYVFDAYGTLFDVHAAAAHHAEALGPKWQQLSDIWRTKQLEYTWVNAAAGAHDTFWNVTVQGLDFAIASVGGVADGMREDLLDAYRTLTAYPEVPEVLKALKARNAKLAILSNGDLAMLETAVGSAGLAQMFDALLSVDSVGIFKPSMKVYALATDRFGVAPNEISFQSSNRWDIAGGNIFGFKTAWINRANKPDEYPNNPPQRVLSDLRGLLDE
ncbi:MAG: haloacid dehalogenase type II [Hyphomicrobiaceae bacterium]